MAHFYQVSEMTYHDIFERSFRESPGPDRLVSFDPPDAIKVASAVRASQVQSFQNKAASARGGGSMDKTAEAVPTAPRARNPFVEAMAAAQRDPTAQHKEARHIVKVAQTELKEV